MERELEHCISSITERPETTTQSEQRHRSKQETKQEINPMSKTSTQASINPGRIKQQ